MLSTSVMLCPNKYFMCLSLFHYSHTRFVTNDQDKYSHWSVHSISDKNQCENETVINVSDNQELEKQSISCDIKMSVLY